MSTSITLRWREPRSSKRSSYVKAVAVRRRRRDRVAPRQEWRVPRWHPRLHRKNRLRIERPGPWLWRLRLPRRRRLPDERCVERYKPSGPGPEGCWFGYLGTRLPGCTAGFYIKLEITRNSLLKFRFDCDKLIFVCALNLKLLLVFLVEELGSRQRRRRAETKKESGRRRPSSTRARVLSHRNGKRGLYSNGPKQA